jgi:hypothetical protein
VLEGVVGGASLPLRPYLDKAIYCILTNTTSTGLIILCTRVCQGILMVEDILK